MSGAEPKTIEEFLRETLVEKHTRLMQAKCKHEPWALVVSSYSGPGVSFTDTVCVDCGKHWRSER